MTDQQAILAAAVVASAEDLRRCMRLPADTRIDAALPAFVDADTKEWLAVALSPHHIKVDA